MHFRPLHDRVLVRRVDAEHYLSQYREEEAARGRDLAAGPGGRNE